MDPRSHQKSGETWKKTRLETKSTKHVQNIWKIMPSDLWKSSFRMEWLQSFIKTRSAYKFNKLLQNEKNGVATLIKSVTIGPWCSTKMMLKNIPKKWKSDSRIGRKNWVYFRGGASLDTFGGPNRFAALKMPPPGVPKGLPIIKNESKMTPKRPPITKRAPKLKPFRRGLADCAKRLQLKWSRSKNHKVFIFSFLGLVEMSRVP